MTEIRDRSTVLINLVEDKVAEQLDEVAVARLGPSGVVVEPAVTVEGERHVSNGARRKLFMRKRTHSGRSLMKPNLVSNRTNRPFSNSRISSASSVSSALSTTMQNALASPPPTHTLRARKTHTKLELSSSSTLAPINANTSSIVFLGPGLLKRYKTTFLRSGE